MTFGTVQTPQDYVDGHKYNHIENELSSYVIYKNNSYITVNVPNKDKKPDEDNAWKCISNTNSPSPDVDKSKVQYYKLEELSWTKPTVGSISNLVIKQDVPFTKFYIAVNQDFFNGNNTLISLNTDIDIRKNPSSGKDLTFAINSIFYWELDTRSRTTTKMDVENDYIKFSIDLGNFNTMSSNGIVFSEVTAKIITPTEKKLCIEQNDDNNATSSATNYLINIMCPESVIKLNKVNISNEKYYAYYTTNLTLTKFDNKYEKTFMFMNTSKYDSIIFRFNLMCHTLYETTHNYTFNGAEQYIDSNITLNKGQIVIYKIKVFDNKTILVQKSYQG